MWFRVICIGFWALFISLEAIAVPIAHIGHNEIDNASYSIPETPVTLLKSSNRNRLYNTPFGLSTAYSDTGKLPSHIKRIQNLPSFLSESSALCETAEGIWSINDSHNPSSLYLLRRKAYELWRDSGRVILDAHFIQFDISVKNNDWEALESDGTYLYLGDFGNNRGNRRDLCIIKIPIGSLIKQLSSDTQFQIDSIIETPIKALSQNQNIGLDNLGDSIASMKKFLIDSEQTVIRTDSILGITPGSMLVVNCTNLTWEKIQFTYPDQANFEIRRMHNFDCEAMVIEEKRIVLLSKNWKNLRCDIYTLPKETGTYVATRMGGFNPGFLITDATNHGNTWYVCGYGPSGNQYIGSINRKNFKGFTRKKLPLKPAQIEGIHYDARAKQFILSTEARKTQAQAIMLLHGQ